MSENTMEHSVFWITGLSGAGKTTVGRALYAYLKEKGVVVALLDGDEMRNVLNNEDYSKEGRRDLAFKYARLGDWLYRQGINVITCTVSMYDEVREWNRHNIPGYKEIYLELPIEELIRRDQKSMYTSVQKGTNQNVCGMDMEVELPEKPDLIVSNFGNITPAGALELIINRFGI